MNQVCLSVLTRPRCTQCGGKPKNKSESHQTLSVWICTAKERERGKSILSDIREAPPSSSVRCCGTSKEKRDIILFFFYLFDSANDSEWMEPRWEMAGCGRCISCRRSRHWMSGTRKRRYDTVFFCLSVWVYSLKILKLYFYIYFRYWPINTAVQKTVRNSSWTQSLKNIPTAGFVKAIRYSAAKVNKFWTSYQLHKSSEKKS
jgi:hypothetical protein